MTSAIPTFIFYNIFDKFIMLSKQLGECRKKLYLKTTAIPKTARNQPKETDFSHNLQTYTPKNKKCNILPTQFFIQRCGSQQQFSLKLPKEVHDLRQPQLIPKDRTVSVKTTISTKNRLLFNTQSFQSKYESETQANNFTDTTSGSSVGAWSPTQKIKTNFFKSKKFQSKKSNKFSSKFQLENFEIMKKLGNGKFGKVFLVRQKLTNFILAMKVVQKVQIIKEGMLNQFIRQLKIQSYLNHQNIIQNYGFFDDKKYFYILMELGCDGQLYNLMKGGKKYNEQVVAYISNSLLSATDYMHSHGIVHRDIKPENIVLILGTIKLSDFGWATKIQKFQLRQTYCGTPLYLSPEMLKSNGYDEKIDIWAIGIIAFQLKCGITPFNINCSGELNKILNQQIKVEQSTSKDFSEFIHKILTKNPLERPSCHELLQLKFIKIYQQLQTCQQLCC